MIEFTIPGQPRGKGRPRFTRNGTAYTPKETTAYEKLTKAQYYEALKEYQEKDPGGHIHWCEGQVEVDITAYFGIARYVTQKVREKIMAGEELPLKKPDLDNIAKIILDALNGSAYRDDKQVTDLTIRKRYDIDGKGERVVVRIKDRQEEE